MPLIKTINLDDETQIGIWKIEESIEQFVQRLYLNEEEFETLHSFKSDYRKKQWLSYRVLIRTMVQIDTIYKIYYTTSGKPFLIHPPRIISVSHSKSKSAVLVSTNTNRRYGIDIESIDKKILCLKGKFLNPIELIQFSIRPSIELLTVLWSAKEAVYKCFDLPVISLKKNISITYCKKRENKFDLNAKLYIDNTCKYYTVKSILIDNYVLSYTQEI
jgi:4'-phosphopantetheinyl transferase